VTRPLRWLCALLAVGATAGGATRLALVQPTTTQGHLVVSHNDIFGNGQGIGGMPYTDGGGNIAVDPQFVSLTPGAGFLVVGTASPADTGSGNGSPQGAHMGDAIGVASRLLAHLTAVAAVNQQTPTP
jgi:hypothetical protein